MIHGTRSTIRAGCHCHLCVLVAETTPVHMDHTLVPSGHARAHLEQLLTSGWTIRTLATHTGYGVSTLYEIRSGRHSSIRDTTAEDILAVDPKVAAA